MTPKHAQPETFHERLADISETMQREKVVLSLEIKKYFSEELGKLNDKLANGEPIYPKDMEFIENIKRWIKMPKEYRDNYPSIDSMAKASIDLIKEMNLEKSYEEMVDTLKNYGYTDTIPDKKTVINAIQNLGPGMLENIKKFNRPTILMTPEATLGTMKEKLDQNKKFPNQGDTYFAEATGDVLWNPTSRKFSVSIVDGAPEIPQLPTDKKDLDNEQKHRYLTAEYKKQGMKMISAREYAMLAQKSLRSYELSQKIDEIIDQKTFTYLNAEHLTVLQKVPRARWDSDPRRFGFRWFTPASQRGNMRGRPSVQVL